MTSYKKNLFAALLCLSSALTPLAMAQQACQLPPISAQNPPNVRVDYRNPQAPVDYYLLSVSWSPEFCASKGQKPYMQCQLNKFEWVVHGLWPQNAAARNVREHPRFCQTTPVPLDIAKNHLCMMPDPYLIQAEWQKHGSCAFAEPQAYLAKTQKLWQGLVKPSLAGVRELTVGELKQAWVQKNPQLKPDFISVKLGKKRFLEEVGICYNKNDAPMSCQGNGNRNSPPDYLRIKIAS